MQAYMERIKLTLIFAMQLIAKINYGPYSIMIKWIFLSLILGQLRLDRYNWKYQKYQCN